MGFCGRDCESIFLNTSTVNKERKYPRIEGSWPVVILTTRGALAAETRNISIHGAFVVCDKPLPPKEELRLFIMFPNRRYLDILAEVTWSYPYGSMEDKTPCGMGLRFSRISAADREFISSLASGYLRTASEQGSFMK